MACTVGTRSNIRDMSTRSLLIFDLDGERFGLDATRVHESIWLPELSPIEEAPPYIVGIFNLRGLIVPVTDLGLRFGHPARSYLVSDQVVVLELDKLLMGLIVSEVIEVIDVSLEAIQAPPKFDERASSLGRMVAGEVRVGDDIVALLDAGQLMQPSQEIAESTAAHPASHFCPQATPEQHAVFHARALELLEKAAPEDEVQHALAVVGLGDEYFGIELQAIQEFCDVIQPTPIPCCPLHVMGAISLRGNVLTLLDLRAALNLPRATQDSRKAVIAFLGEQLVGVAVDDVHDVVYLRAEELQTMPEALREPHGVLIKGSAPYAGKMMVLLDLPALLARQEWIVNETC